MLIRESLIMPLLTKNASICYLTKLLRFVGLPPFLHTVQFSKHHYNCNIFQSFKEGFITQCRVYAIARRKPKGDEPDIQPKRNEETGMWQCPLCLRDNFPELSEIWNHFDTTGSCPGQAVGIRVRLDNGMSGFIATKNISDSRITNPEDRIKVSYFFYSVLCSDFQTIK